MIELYGIDGFLELASKYKYDQSLGCRIRDYHETDLEFAERFNHFVFDKIVNKEGQTLNDVIIHMVIVSTLIGCQRLEEFRTESSRTLDVRLTLVILKDVVYGRWITSISAGRGRSLTLRTKSWRLVESISRSRARRPPRWRITCRGARTSMWRSRPPDGRGLEGRTH